MIASLKLYKNFLMMSLVMFVGVTLLCRLGFWQLSRAAYKQNLQQQFELSSQQKTLGTQDLLNLDAQNQTWRFQNAAIQSYFNNEKIILLDNVINHGQVGYAVLQAAYLNDDSLILVNRGFVPLGHNRQQLPSISTILGEVNIAGYLDIAYRNPLIQEMTEKEQVNWPLRVQQLNVKQLEHYFNKKIVPMILVLDSQAPFAYASLSPKTIWLTTQRHYGYAFQWFACALTFALLCSFVLWRMFNHQKCKEK